jgi:transketolase
MSFPELVGGSADLTPSNNTKAKKDQKDIRRGDLSGRYIHYGVREHGMAAAISGIAAHAYVITHDSIGLARTARPTSRSSVWRRCARCRVFTSTARLTRSRPPSAGRWR